MKRGQSFSAGNEFLLTYNLRSGILQSSIIVKYLFVLLFFLCVTDILVAQEPLSSMSKEKRDSVLVEITQNLLKEKFPKRYCKNVIPIIEQGDFMFYSLKWVQKDDYYRIPDYLKPEDLNYKVTLYEECKGGLEKSRVIADALIIDKTHEVFKVWPGPLSLLDWYQLKDYQPKLLSAMPKEKRDSILVEISQNLLKEEYPKLYRKNVVPSIVQGDFKILTISGLDSTKEYIPDCVVPDDIYYVVQLYYENWKEDKFESPFTALYILDKTQEVYKIQLATELEARKVNQRKASE